MRTKQLLFACLGALVAEGSLAGTMGDNEIHPTWTRMMTLSIGPSWKDSNKKQTLFLQPDIEKTYVANKKTIAFASGEFFFGWQRPIASSLFLQVGAAVAASSNTKLSGDIWEDADPDFNNYFYRYKVNHAHVGIKSKLVADIGSIIQPYFSGSVGVGRNRAHAFEITPKLCEEVPAPGFASRSTTAFTYSLGIGAQKSINVHWSAGLGYEFSNWGKSRLGMAPGQTLGSGLQLNQLYIYQLQFNLSYLA